MKMICQPSGWDGNDDPSTEEKALEVAMFVAI